MASTQPSNEQFNGDPTSTASAHQEAQTRLEPSTRGQLTSAKSSSSIRSPPRSRDPSPSKQLRSPSTPSQAQDLDLGANNGTLTPSRPSGRIPRPVSLNDASNRLLKGGTSDEPPPKWPMSPRLRSPNTSRRDSNPDLSDLDSTPKASRIGGPTNPESGPKTTQQPSSGAKLPRNYSSIASTLETVEEIDQGTSPQGANDMETAPSGLESSQESLSRQTTMSTQASSAQPAPSPHTAPASPPSHKSQLSQASTASTASSSQARKEKNFESTGSEADVGRSRNVVKQPPPKQATQSQPPPSTTIKRSGLGPLRARPANEGSSQNMIVETETVPSIPQSSTTNEKTSGKREESASLRHKPSTDTIRPKKERKKMVQKKASVISGASTKADLFEAKVATTDDNSDSDETFVYESNPPEPIARALRHHVRTPSGNSMHSFADRRNGRVASGHRGPKPKRSMKFASSSYADRGGDDDSGDGQGTVRAHKSKPPSLNVSQPHGYSSHWPGGYTPTGGESPYSAAARARQNRSNRNSPRDTPSHSPPPYSNTQTPNNKSGYSPYHSDHSRHGNEREPLLGSGSLRTPRTRPSQRPHPSSLRHIEYYQDPPRSFWARRFSGCLVGIIVLLLLSMCIAGFVYATTKPLYEVNLLDVQNILASEEELMFDLNVIAVNPNMITITVSDVDINVFAKSRHVGTEDHWRRRHGAPEPNPSRKPLPFINSPHPHPGGERYNTQKRVDHGTDPIDDPDSEDPQTMLLGRILKLDSPLTFDSSPLRRIAHNSTGELRLEKPGNKTETGGSERWERVIQHPFQLVVRGVLKYTLPLSSRAVSSSVSKIVLVDPDENVPGKHRVGWWEEYKDEGEVAVEWSG